jgi:hypothetical protein
MLSTEKRGDAMRMLAPLLALALLFCTVLSGCARGLPA